MVEMRVQGRERGMEVWYGRDEGTGEGEGVWYGRDEGTGEGEGDGGLVWYRWGYRGGRGGWRFG